MSMGVARGRMSTFLRGGLIYSDGKIVGPPRGEYLRRPQGRGSEAKSASRVPRGYLAHVGPAPAICFGSPKA